MSFLNDNNPAAQNSRDWNWRIGSAAAAVVPINLQTFFGIDGNGAPDQSIPAVTGVGAPFATNSDIAFATFESYATVVPNVGFIATQDFEGIATGTLAPLVFNLNPGGLGNIQCTLLGSSGIIKNIPVDTAIFGRWSVPTQTSTQIWEAVADTISTFSIEFNQDVNGFGFYGTDIGDFDGTLEMDFQNAAGQSLVKKTINALSLPANARDGNCLFFGAVSNGPTAANKFRKVVFRLSIGVLPDGFGFDRFTVVRIP